MVGGTASLFLAAGLQAQNLRIFASGQDCEAAFCPLQRPALPSSSQATAVEMAPPSWLSLPSLIHVVGRCLSSAGA